MVRKSEEKGEYLRCAIKSKAQVLRRFRSAHISISRISISNQLCESTFSLLLKTEKTRWPELVFMTILYLNIELLNEVSESEEECDKRRTARIE